MVRTTSKVALPVVVVSLVEHCNLNCLGCAPLAEETFLSVEEFTNDMKRLAELTSESGLGKINFMGGEPLLHPDIEEFITISRRFFPQPVIQITTNTLSSIPRKESGGEVISASRVRKFLETKDFESIAKLVPETTLNYLKEKFK